MSDLLNDPLKFVQLCWPDLRLYDKQAEIMESVRDNDETIVPAGNMLGKDFIAGLIVLWFFCSRSPCRIVTSSSGQAQLKSVLWGEIRNFARTSRYPLPIVINSMDLYQLKPDGTQVEKSYVKGIVTNEPENLQGHHLSTEQLLTGHGGIGGSRRFPRTLAIFDEASSIEDKYYDAVDTWAHRKLIIGNPLPCANIFYRTVKAGDILR